MEPGGNFYEKSGLQRAFKKHPRARGGKALIRYKRRGAAQWEGRARKKSRHVVVAAKKPRAVKGEYSYSQKKEEPREEELRGAKKKAENVRQRARNGGFVEQAWGGENTYPRRGEGREDAAWGRGGMSRREK